MRKKLGESLFNGPKEILLIGYRKTANICEVDWSWNQRGLITLNQKWNVGSSPIFAPRF